MSAYKLPPLNRKCLQCDGPKSYGAGKFCRPCYRNNALYKKIWPKVELEIEQGYLDMEKRGLVYMKAGGWHFTEAGWRDFNGEPAFPDDLVDRSAP